MINDVENLKAENLDLKLDFIRQEAQMFKNDVYSKLDLILEKTSETNDNVGQALERIAKIEKQDTETKIKDIKDELSKYEMETKPWRIITTNRWVRWIIYLILSASGLQFGVSIGEIIKGLLK